MREIGKVAAALFDKIRTRFDHINVGDKSAKSTTKPEEARFFNFEYVGRDGNKFGNITISIIDENSLKVYFGKNISDALDEEQQDEWYAFLKELRHFAKRNLMSFDTRDIGRSNLDIRSLKQQGEADGTFKKHEVSESRLYGYNGRQSFADIGPAKLLIRHSDKINPDQKGSRARKIESIFIETDKGERFLLPHTNLVGARAMARHVGEGGSCHDEIGESINGMVKEMNAMAHFVRSAKRRQFEDTETQEMTQSALRHWEQMRRTLRSLTTGRNYRSYLENFVPETPVEDEVDVDGLRDRFARKVYDDRFDEALPYVYRAYQRDKAPGVKEFESWVHSVGETELTEEETNFDIEEFNKVISKPLAAGIDGTDAIMALNSFIDSDELDDMIYQVSQEPGGEDAAVNDIVKAWMSHQDEFQDVMGQLEFWSEDQAAQNQVPAPVAPPPPPPPPAQQAPASQPQPTPAATESIDWIKRLAGLAK